MSTAPRRLSFAVGSSLLTLSLGVGCTDGTAKDDSKSKRPDDQKTVNEGPQNEPEPIRVNEGPQPQPPEPTVMVNPGPEPEAVPSEEKVNPGPEPRPTEGAGGINVGPQPEPQK